MKKLTHREDVIPLPIIGDSNTKKVESWSLLSSSDISVPPSIDYALYNQITENSAIPQATRGDSSKFAEWFLGK